MKESSKLSSTWRKRLALVLVFSILGVAALAVTLPGVLIGPVGGSLAGY